VAWVPLLQGDEVLSWIAWWSAGDLALRILHVWIYDNTGGSMFGQALFHASFNVAWQLFPNDGSHFDPAFTTPILVAAALLVVGWSRRGQHGMPPVQRKFGFTKSCEGRTVAAESPETLVDHRKVIARGSGDSPASEDPPVQPSKASGGGHEHTRWRSP
jgi:hypothetical protein